MGWARGLSIGALLVVGAPLLFYLDLNEASILLTACATVIVAVFTWTLSQATTATQQVTERTLAHLQREFLATHRPHLKIRHVEFIRGEDETAIAFTVVNVGESTATIIESSVTPWIWVKGDKWPALPPYAPKTANPRVKTLANGQESRWKETDETWALFLVDIDGSKTHDMMLLGYIVYADENGTRRRLGFCHRRLPNTERFEPVPDLDYNYED